MLEVHLCHLKYIIAISQEYIPSFTILGHILIFTFLKASSSSGSSLSTQHALYRLIGSHRHLHYIHFQTILDHFKLQLPYRTDNLTSIKLIDK